MKFEDVNTAIRGHFHGIDLWRSCPDDPWPRGSNAVYRETRASLADFAELAVRLPYGRDEGWVRVLTDEGLEMWEDSFEDETQLESALESAVNYLRGELMKLERIISWRRDAEEED